MNASQLLAEKLQDVFLKGKWIAHTNYREQLEQLSFSDAITRIAGLNSIAQLSFHIDYYLAGLIDVLKGAPLNMSDQLSFDLQDLQSPEEWQLLVQRLLQHANTFAELVAAIPDSQLNAAFVAPQYGTYRKNIEAVIEHSYYHLGQIVLIRKLIERS